MNGRRILVVIALLVAAIAGCARLGELITPSAPGVSDEWAALLQEIRAFERRIGFAETDNFTDFSQEQEAFPFCGYVSHFVLPYSYEDPAITWLEPATEEECRQRAGNADVYFNAVEAWGEIGTSITSSMIANKLDRFLYVVIHEDCHDQFGLPYGIEEALCDLITNKAMAAFTDDKYGTNAREDRAIRRYAETRSRQTRAIITYYGQLAALYARYERKEIAPDELLRERAAIYKNAQKPLAWAQSDLNNVGIANSMTYSRHYPFLESVFDALGRDLAKTVALFRHVDEVKPTSAAVMKRYRIANKNSVEYIRANEAAVLETIRKELAADQAQKL